MTIPNQHDLECSSWVMPFNIFHQNKQVWKYEIPGHNHNLNLLNQEEQHIRTRSIKIINVQTIMYAHIICPKVKLNIYIDSLTSLDI